MAKLKEITNITKIKRKSCDFKSHKSCMLFWAVIFPLMLPKHLSSPLCPSACFSLPPVSLHSQVMQILGHNDNLLQEHMDSRKNSSAGETTATMSLKWSLLVCYMHTLKLTSQDLCSASTKGPFLTLGWLVTSISSLAAVAILIAHEHGSITELLTVKW